MPSPTALTSQVSSESLTYEATKARDSNRRDPDQIHWDADQAFRHRGYRQLHHQRGLIGVLRIRLLEAANLQRSYWSALALGPVKHLGLSKAHGAVSSFCSFTLIFESVHTPPVMPTERLDQKPSARPKPLFASPVVARDNSPVWENCQFEARLRKGALGEDGRRVLLHVRVEEDATAVENLLPGLPKSGDARLLGEGRLDVTELLLGETPHGQALPGVLDAWIDLTLTTQSMPEEFQHVLGQDPLAPPPPLQPSSTQATGKVRLLVSYQPHGLEPQPRDVIALEAFARRPPSSSCRPLIPPLMPLVVLERRGPFLLAEYTLADDRKACVRLHRNAVFVIERKNIVDAAHNLALLPIDVLVSTPVGAAASDALGPLVAAGKELLMPALLSLKLVWMAARTTTLAGLSGVTALSSTLWHEGSTSLTASHDTERRREAATAQYVSL